MISAPIPTPYSRAKASSIPPVPPGSPTIATTGWALAKGGEVLMTGHTAALVPTLEGVYFESRGRQELRNVREPVEVFAAIPTPHERKEETLVRRQ